MLITGIERTKKGRFSIFGDGEFICALHPDIFAASPIRTGGEISPEALEALHRESEMKITKDRALRLLSARSYTTYRLFRKLTERADEECARAAVDRMIQLNLVDDADYARRYASDCVKLKGYSLRRTKQALMEKGIDRDLAEEVISEMDDDPQPAIARIILKKYFRYLDDEKGQRKTINALLRLGYQYGDIRVVVENLLEDSEYYMENSE